MAHFTAFDIVVLLLIGLGGLAGLSRGFVTEVLSLLGWVAAFFAVRLLFPAGKLIAAKFTGTEAGGAVLAFAVIFIVTFVIFRTIAGSLGARTRNSVVGPLDRILGLGFGAFKGLLGAAVLFLLGTLVYDVLDPGEPRPEWLRAARTGPLVEVTSKAMVDFVEQRRKSGSVKSGDKTPADRSADRPDRDKSDRDKPDSDKPGRDRGYGEKERGALDSLLDSARNTSR
ncbi:CvpA family protein [Glacieibacterium sp.]|uniref:CvpA family protein n=1 Tax=Glacieibacterium sp. TaxID=2860237 RepID=UPI003AFFCAC6